EASPPSPIKQTRIHASKAKRLSVCTKARAPAGSSSPRPSEPSSLSCRHARFDMAAAMVWVPILEDGVFRFDVSEAARVAAGPSLSFAEPRRREVVLRDGAGRPAVVPECEVVGDDVHRVLIKLPSGTSFYGTGEASGPLERTGKRVFTWNTDAWGYGSGTTSLYQSHPWVLSILPDGKSLGVLADTTRRCEIDLRQESTIKFAALSAYPIITFGPFDTPAQVVASLSHAIGTVSMPSKWALGYHQCRFSYKSSERVLEVIRTFREKGIPCDVVWMDIDYMDGFRCFTFDNNRFADPKSMVDDLHSIGCKSIWMLDPGIKEEKGYFVYDGGSENDVWIKKADGSPFIGEVWPGDCVFPDFTSERIRTWWARLVRDFISNGVDGIWNDMNEPAMTTTTKTMPESNIHRGDADIGGVQNHSYYHNVYGMLMARSTYEGMVMYNTEKRPFVLTRAGFIGSQRYAATWTGDNLSNWEHLHMSLSMVLQLGLSGQPLSGPDIGGFAGNATPRLFGRWMGVGALFPFSRGHSEAGTVDHEPWSFGEEVLFVCFMSLIHTVYAHKQNLVALVEASMSFLFLICYILIHKVLVYPLFFSLFTSQIYRRAFLFMRLTYISYNISSILLCQSCSQTNDLGRVWLPAPSPTRPAREGTGLFGCLVFLLGLHRTLLKAA
uniref:Uncharacterized protein n=1 Tax=Aegilops tauschii subsp. strangulata TaxID=200361 RepID=A0A453QVJ7_AEGTS